jgi:hypothetical protein
MRIVGAPRGLFKDETDYGFKSRADEARRSTPGSANSPAFERRGDLVHEGRYGFGAGEGI